MTPAELDLYAENIGQAWVVCKDEKARQLVRELVLKVTVLSKEKDPQAVLDILAERQRQDNKWGEQNHDPSMWVVILAEEVGEVAQEALHKNGLNYRAEMVQVAAVALAAIQSYDRQESKSKE